jgi:hypothetical protein
LEIFTLIAAFLFGMLIALGGFIIGLKKPPLTILPASAYMFFAMFGYPFSAFHVWPHGYAELAGTIVMVIYWLTTQDSGLKGKEVDYKVRAVGNGNYNPGTNGRQPIAGQIYRVIAERTARYKDSSFAPVGHECGTDPCPVCESLPDVLLAEVRIYDLEGHAYGWQPRKNFVPI